MLALLALGALPHCGGCSEPCRSPSCPTSPSCPQKVLSKDEQQGKVNEMIAKGQKHQTEAAKEIEKDK